MTVKGSTDKQLTEIHDHEDLPKELESLDITGENSYPHHEKGEGSNHHIHDISGFESKQEQTDLNSEEILGEEKATDPVFDGIENPEMDVARSLSGHSLLPDSEAQSSAWPEKAAALKNFVKERGVVAVERGAVAVSSVLRLLSGKKDEDGQSIADSEVRSDSLVRDAKEEDDSIPGSKPKEASQRPGEMSTWNPLSYIRISRDVDLQNKNEHREHDYVEDLAHEPVRGRITLYTRLGSQDCQEVRSFLRQKGLKLIEINIDVYPNRKLELEKNAGSSAVPKVFFNDLLVGGLTELRAMDESGKLDEKINELIHTDPSPAAPLPPFPGEDDVSSTGTVDELAIIVRKMRESIVVKDRFYKMRRFSNCFLGSEAVDFLSEDQYLEREEAVEFGRKLVNKCFFHHVLDENVFEDGNHLYRLLDHDPIIATQCCNIPRGTVDVKPKPITEIASRLRFLSFAIFEAYVSDDGRHVDYRSIGGSEEFARLCSCRMYKVTQLVVPKRSPGFKYVRITEELQRVELHNVSREEKLAFFINLYNMMAIHAILLWGYPTRALERRKLLGDFKYVIGGCPYSLSAIQNGILRGNQRPPYNLMKPFGLRDKRSQASLPYPEPLVHFALVCGTRSGPALRCFSPGDIDKELMEAARNFLRNGGIVIDAEARVASVSKILRWYSVDFGKNEIEVMKHATNYLEPTKSELLLVLLALGQLKVIYQPYDWALNC